MPHPVRIALLVCLLWPGAATALVISFTGTVETVVDPSDFLDSSVAAGVPVTGTYELELSSADAGSPFAVGLAQLAFQLGTYGFAASQPSHAVALIDDHATGVPGITIDLWQSRAIAAAELTPASHASGDFAGYAAQIEFYDFDSAIFDGGETQPIDPTDPIVYPLWEQVRLTLNSINGSGDIDGRVQVQMAITVPEPRSAALLAIGLASLAHQRRRTRSPGSPAGTEHGRSDSAIAIPRADSPR